MREAYIINTFFHITGATAEQAEGPLPGREAVPVLPHPRQGNRGNVPLSHTGKKSGIIKIPWIFQ